MGLFGKLQDSKSLLRITVQYPLLTVHVAFEVYRLQQRYTRRKGKSSAASGAIYMDGEYVYSAPTSSRGSERWGKGSSKTTVREVGGSKRGAKAQ
jgi:hypothetical protein